MTNKDKISNIDDFQNSNTYNTSDDSDDSKFTDLYTKTMDNVTMSQENKDVIRAKLAEQSQTGRSGRKLIRIGKYSAIAATVCAVLLCIPATRTTVSAAHRLHKADIPPGKWHRGDIRGKQRGKLHTVHNIYR